MNRCFGIVGMLVLALLVTPRPAQAVESFFDVFTELTAGPPYPTPPVELTVSHQAGATMVQTQIIGVGLQVVDNNSPAKTVAYDSGGGGGAGVQSFFDVFTELSTDDYPADSFFDVFVELRRPAIAKASPMLDKPPHADYAGSFFDVFFDVTVEDGVESLHVRGEIGPGQPLMFTGAPIGSVFDSFFDVFVTLNSSGPVVRESPLFTMTMTGTFVPEPATLVLLMIGGIGVTALSRRRK